MKMRVVTAVALACAAFAGAASLPASAAVSPDTTSPRLVMTWMPSYAIDASETQLKRMYSGAGPSNALSHLGLQFWLPTAAGGLQRSPDGDTSDGKISEIATWAHQHGIKVMLCVFNSTGGKWNWELAKSAFQAHRAAFITRLAAEVQRLGLDGVDVDFEGDESDHAGYNLNQDRAAYVSFVSGLSHQLHVNGKQITVDSFPYIWNAPNQTWWADLLPKVNGMTSMGYRDVGRKAPGWQAYAAQKKAAAHYAKRLMIGLPSDMDSWQGTPAYWQVDWFTHTTGVGVSIWDAQFPAAGWQKANIWKLLKALRDGTVP